MAREGLRGRRSPPVRSLWWVRGEAMVVAADPIDSALTTEVRRTEAPWCDNRIGINRGLPRLDHGNIHQAPWEPAHELQIEQPVTVVCECVVEHPRSRNGLGGNDRGLARENDVVYGIIGYREQRADRQVVLPSRTELISPLVGRKRRAQTGPTPTPAIGARAFQARNNQTSLIN